jgi:hypothetical protein
VTSIAPFPFGVTVEIHRTVVDRFGDETVTLHHTIEGCALAPRYSTEFNNDRNQTIVGFSLFGPPQTGDNRVFATDRVKTPDGIMFRVVGEAATWTHPITGWTPGFEAALERVT